MKKLLFIILSFLICQDQYLVTIDATSYENWVYYSLSEHNIIDIDDPENSIEWDLAFKRKHIKTNSGLSGIGNGGAYVDSTITWTNEWDNINQVPGEIEWTQDSVLNDFYDPNEHIFNQGVKNAALNAWGWFDENYYLNVTHYAFFVKYANGVDVIKFWPYSYYDTVAGVIDIHYETGYIVESNNCDGILGDSNADGIVNVVDIVSIVSYVLGATEFTECEFILSDQNQDGLVNVVDIVAVVSIILSN